MTKVALIGNGNVSFHLEKVFRSKENIEVTVHNGRNELSQKKIKTADICIIAVNDSAIPEVSAKLKGTNALVAHTSGSVSMNTLPEAFRKGVFYPLQTFSKEKEVDFSTVPICIEAENRKDIDLLAQLAGRISKNVEEVSSTQRKSLHLAAVFANNFTNHLYHLAGEICTASNLSFDLLRPLIAETAEKIQKLTPFEAQTGPARRRDAKTIETHLKQLGNSRNEAIYELFSQSIRNTYGKKL